MSSDRGREEPERKMLSSVKLYSVQWMIVRRTFLYLYVRFGKLLKSNHCLLLIELHHDIILCHKYTSDGPLSRKFILSSQRFEIPFEEERYTHYDRIIVLLAETIIIKTRLLNMIKTRQK